MYRYVFYLLTLDSSQMLRKEKQFNREKKSWGARLRNIFLLLISYNNFFFSALFNVYTCSHELEPSVFNISIS